MKEFVRKLRLEDFDSMELTGTTNSSANTESKFRHARNEAPRLWIALEGNVYVPRQGLAPKEIDIRSSNTSEAFRVLLIF